MKVSKAAGGISRYDFVEKIGDGGMGSVYRAVDRETGDTVAVKVLNVRLGEHPELHHRFAQEFRAATKLEHPNIVRAIDFGMDRGESYLVSEFVDGLSLGELIAERGRLPEDEAVRIMTQVAQALHYAHTGRVIHRDVKPDNILIRNDGMAKLLDFGLAKDCDDDRGLTKPAHGLGTPHFMAPEQYADAKNAGVACDIYSLGATLYNALTGRMPFDGCASLIALSKKVKGDIPSPRELVPDLSHTVDEAVRRAMDPDPSRRPASCLDFFRLLARPSAGRQTPAGPAEDPPGAERRTTVRHPFTFGASCIVETALHGGAEDSLETWPLLVRDVSLGGIGLLLARRFEPGTELCVSLPGEDAAPHVLSARVVRVGSDGLGHWTHGCVFDTPLTDEQLAALLVGVQSSNQHSHS